MTIDHHPSSRKLFLSNYKITKKQDADIKFQTKISGGCQLGSRLIKKICYFRGIARLLEAIHIVAQ